MDARIKAGASQFKSVRRDHNGNVSGFMAGKTTQRHRPDPTRHTKRPMARPPIGRTRIIPATMPARDGLDQKRDYTELFDVQQFI